MATTRRLLLFFLNIDQEKEDKKIKLIRFGVPDRTDKCSYRKEMCLMSQYIAL